MIELDTKGKTLSSIDQLREALKPQSVKHAALYSAVAIATTAVGTAQAGIIIVDNAPVSVGSLGSVAWDINGDSIADATFYDSDGNSDTFCLASSSASGQPLIAYQSGADSVLSVLSGMSVDASNSFENFNCSDLADTTCGHTHFDAFTNFNQGANFGGVLGFQFDNLGTINYGIARFQITSNDGQLPYGAFSITEWAYDDTGAAIRADALDVSEPGTLALLVLGAAGLRLRRKAAMAS